MELTVTDTNATLAFKGGISITVKNTNALYGNPCSYLMLIKNKMRAKIATPEEIQAFDSLMVATKFLFFLPQTAFHTTESLERMFDFALKETEHYMKALETENLEEGENMQFMKQFDEIFNTSK